MTEQPSDPAIDAPVPDWPAKGTFPGDSPPGIFQSLNRTARFPYPKNEYVRRLLWYVVQGLLVYHSPRKAKRWRRFWLRRFGADMLGSTSRKVTIRHPWLLHMEERTMVAEDSEIYNLGPVRIGCHTVISQNVYLCAGTHDYMRPELPLIRPSITIGRGVWICAGAFIGPGVTIGDNSIVAARAVVTRDVPPGVIVGGNPARVLRDRPMPGLDPAEPDPDRAD